MHRTVAGDHWKALKMSARKLARDARALQKASLARAGPPGDAKTARAGDWPRQRPRPSSSGARPEDLTIILGIVWGWISTTGSGLIKNLFLPKLFHSHRDFAASRLRVIPLVSREDVNQILHHDPTTPIRVYLL